MSFSSQRVIGLLVSHFGTSSELNAANREEKKLFNRFKMLLEEVTEGRIFFSEFSSVLCGASTITLSQTA